MEEEIMLKLPAIFSDHMVLQRNKNIAVWGESSPGIVTVSLNNCTVETEVQNGKWELFLPPHKAGGPYQMVIKNGNDVINFNDIIIGEVWLAGGQSNMEFELQNSTGGSDIIKNASGDNVRFYYTPKVAWKGEELYKAEEESSWSKFNPLDCKIWSAAGYHFADKLSKRLGVTVGIIGCNWGGTSASCWISRNFLKQVPCLSSYLEEYDNIVKDQDEAEYIKELEEYFIYQEEFNKNASHYFETAKNPTWEEAEELFGKSRYPGPMGPRSANRPCGLYESMLARIMPYTIAGFLYYQGEEDSNKPYTYYELLLTLVKQWRHDWKDETLPFMVVQLPVFQDEREPDYKNWPFIREAQMRLYNNIKNTGIAVILECGEYNNIHPVDKEPVGERLMLQAMYHVYGGISAQEAFGPVYKSHYTEGNKMYIKFQYADPQVLFQKEDKSQGIICSEENETNFEIAGADKKYFPAEAAIKGDSVILWSASVKKPMYARYFWTNYNKVTLFGENGIPVAPFRTSYEDGSKVLGTDIQIS